MTLGDAPFPRGQLGQPRDNCLRCLNRLSSPASAGSGRHSAAADPSRKRGIVHRWPEFLPGGKAVLFAAAPTSANWTNAQVAVQSVGTGERRTWSKGDAAPLRALGHLIYAQGGNLMAVPFDPSGLRSPARRSPSWRRPAISEPAEPPSTAFPQRDRWSIFREAFRRPNAGWCGSIAMGQSNP